MSRPNYLFNSKSLSELIRAYPPSIVKDVETWSRDQILGASEYDLAQSLVEKYSLHAPSLRRDEAFIENEGETKIDVSGRFDYGDFGGHEPHYVPGMQVTIAVPFDGDRDLFEFQPSSFTSMPPSGQVASDTLQFSFHNTKLDAGHVKREIEVILNEIDRYLAWLRVDCESWNSRVESVAIGAIKQRKTKLLEQSNTLSALGLPIKRRPQATSTVAISVARKRPAVVRPATAAPFKPEPALPDDEYRYIMQIIDNLSKAIERSPSTFVKMEEEEIRNLILVDLNGHYEGGATGETFNANGKTDILIRAEGRNVFIAECKFWEGRKALHAAIDQILGYLTWRDTKAALIIFSKNADFSRVISEIKAGVPDHPNFKKALGQTSETHIQYLFGQKDDSQRDIFLAVTAFHIPRS